MERVLKMKKIEGERLRDQCIVFQHGPIVSQIPESMAIPDSKILSYPRAA